MISWCNVLRGRNVMYIYCIMWIHRKSFFFFWLFSKMKPLEFIGSWNSSRFAAVSMLLWSLFISDLPTLLWCVFCTDSNFAHFILSRIETYREMIQVKFPRNMFSSNTGACLCIIYNLSQISFLVLDLTFLSQNFFFNMFTAASIGLCIKYFKPILNLSD